MDDQLSAADIRRSARKTNVRDRIQAAAEKMADDHRKEMFRRRVDLARNGIRSYAQKKIPEAVKAFHSYLAVLEDWKEVGEGGLHVGLFDRQKDLSELLLISGVYWDLMKLYDRTKSPERYQDFLHYKAKFIAFTYGLPFQALAAETLRKYMVTGKPVHKKDFADTYKSLASTKCFIATALADELSLDTMPTLREYRDQTLLTVGVGRLVVLCYEKFSPPVAWTLERAPGLFRKVFARALDALARFLS